MIYKIRSVIPIPETHVKQIGNFWFWDSNHDINNNLLSFDSEPLQLIEWTIYRIGLEGES